MTEFASLEVSFEGKKLLADSGCFATMNSHA
jgi:hypothetical protein